MDIYIIINFIYYDICQHLIFTKTFQFYILQICKKFIKDYQFQVEYNFFVIIKTIKARMIPSIHFNCSNPNHTEEQANYICKDEQCIENNPICTLCAFTIHKQHQLEPLKFAIYKVSQDCTSYKQNLVLLAQIDVLKQKLYETCNKISQQDIRKSVKSSIDHFFSLILTKTKLESQNFLKDVQQNNQSQKEVIDLVIKNQKKYILQNIEQQKGNNESNYSRLLKKIAEQLNQIFTNFQEIVKKGQADHSTSQLFVIQNTSKKFKFSSKNKHPKIEITQDNIAKMPDQYVSYNYFVLCDPKLSVNKIQTITFNMVSLTSYVTIGICNIDKIAKNYQFNTGDNNHGSYQISFDGYSYTTNDNSVNSQYTSWYYNQGDKVTLQFNPKTKKLKFIKNQNPNQSYELPIQFEKKDKLHFCVSFNSSPEEVHIVSN